MSYFTSIDDAIVSSTLEFTEISESSMQQFTCKGGEIAGFQIRNLYVMGSNFQVSQIYDCTTGKPVLQGTVSVVPGIDLTGGYFSSGCFADGDPTAEGTKFYQVDYV